jgi:hypothetical protein
MTDANSSMNEVPALLDERRRYEGWLAALDARRESTPKHVFERVHADYRSRLARVAERLSSHRSAIESERANVQARLSLLAAEEQLRRDERAELELRTHVGELAGTEADVAFGEVDQAIARLAGEKEGLAGRVAELQALLDEQVAQPARPEVAPPVAVPVVEVATIQAAPAVPPAAPVAAAPVIPPAAPPAAAPVPVAEAAPMRAEPAPVVAEVVKAAAVQEAKAEPSKQEVAGERATAPKRESFDELAFLSSIVGKPGAAGGQPAVVPEGPLVERRSTEPLLSAPVGIAQEDRPTDSLLAGLENAKPAGAERPLAANVSANMPIILRNAAVTEQVKTLKCTECGAMNYPTEWYCERCGAELAAL